jgi:hypothetical protein
MEICPELGRLIITLMEKTLPEGKHLGLAEPERWTPEAVDFLASTTSGTPKKLCQVS